MDSKFIMDNFRQRSECPHCGRWGKVYCRQISYAMVGMLAYLYWVTRETKPDNGWVSVGEHVPELLRRFNSIEYSKLKFWGLLETHKFSKRGLWRVSNLGIDFLNGAASVPKVVYIFDNMKVQHDEETVKYSDVVGNKIDYEKYLR